MKKIIFCIFFAIGFVVGYVDRPEISVVMSTYNRAKFLPKAIESIRRQTFKDFEFIIINDGSKDKTAAILKKYASKDDRIRVLTNKENKGLIYSLNRGLDAARGKYIARMDDDDFSRPNRLEVQRKYMEEHPLITAVGSWVAKPGTNTAWSFQRELDPEKLKLYMYVNRVPISHPSSFYRRDFIEKHHIRYDDAYPAAEDRKFWLDMVDAGGEIGNIPSLLLEFRQHGTNPKEYYINQWQNSRKFFMNEIVTRFGNKEDFKDLSDCEILRKLNEMNKDKKIVPPDLYEPLVLKYCPKLHGEPVYHNSWKQDAFIFNDNRLCRERQPQECAYIVSHTNNMLRVKWDKWGQETFVKQNGVWHLKKD